MREYAVGTDQDLQSPLTPESMRKLAARGIERHFRRGECLFHQGDQGNSVLLLLKGRVKVCLISSSGLKTILRIHLPGSLIGMSALGSHPFRDGTATPLEPVTVSELTNAEIQAVMLEDSALALRVMRVLLDRLADLHSRLADLQATSVEQRLARVLLALGRSDPNAASNSMIALTHEDLSSLVGARRPTVTTALTRFVDAGLIEKSGRNILIKDAERLTRLLSL
jgi:CRP-like cAMP-binding protein